jgi:hypothetical protein
MVIRPISVLSAELVFTLVVGLQTARRRGWRRAEDSGEAARLFQN